MLTQGMADTVTTEVGYGVEQKMVAVTRWVAAIAAIGLVICSIVMVGETITRGLFNVGISATNELIAAVFPPLIVACIPFGLAIANSLTVDLLTERFSPSTRAVYETLGAILLAVFFGVLAWYTFEYAQSAARRGLASIILDVPKAPTFYVVSALLAFCFVVQCIRCVTLFRLTFGEIRLPEAKLPVVALLLATALLATMVAVYLNADNLTGFAWGNPTTLVLLAFGLLWAMVLMQMPLSATMGLVGLLGMVLFLGYDAGLSTFSSTASEFISKEENAVLPLFLLMGAVATQAGLADDLYRFAHAVLGSRRGGLALATIGGCAGFGAVTGSTVATIATLGPTAYPEMRQRGYSDGLAGGSIAAGGTLAGLIPPSMAIVVYALLAEESIGRLFIAVLIPAMLTVAFYMLAIAILVRVRKDAAPPASGKIDLKEVVRSFYAGSSVLILFSVVMGGIYFGLFTVTEAAAVGVVGTFIIALVRGRLNRKSFSTILSTSTATIAMVYGVIFGALNFSYLVGVSNIPAELSMLVTGLDINVVFIILLLVLIYLLLGTIMESFAIMVITVPIVVPLIQGMGYDAIWWGIIMVAVVELGMITPPFGLNLFVLKAVTKMKVMTIYAGVMPFVIADIAKLILLILFPAITMWLPGMMAR